MLAIANGSRATVNSAGIKTLDACLCPVQRPSLLKRRHYTCTQRLRKNAPTLERYSSKL